MSLPLSDLPELLQRVSGELLERLHYFSLAPQCVLAIGTGAATLMPQLQQRFPKARLLAVDRDASVLQALRSTRRRWLGPRLDCIRADAADLPLHSGSVDLICSHLMLPWSRAPERALQELARVLKPGGLLALATLGPETSPQLIAGAPQPLTSLQLTEMHRLGDALMQAGFAEPVMDVEHFQLRDQGGMPATVEVVFGAAFGAARRETSTDPVRSAEVAIPIEALKFRRQRGPGPDRAD